MRHPPGPRSRAGTALALAAAVILGSATLGRQSDAPSRIARTAESGTLARTDQTEGYSLSLPPGWVTVEVQETALAAVRCVDPAAVMVLVVRREPLGLSLTGMAAQLARNLAKETDCRVIDRGTRPLAGRAAALMSIECPTGDRLEMVVIPREPGPRARTFYGLLFTSPAEGFAQVEPEFHRVLDSFKVLPVVHP